MATVSELSVKNRAEKLAEAIVRNVPRLPHCYDELTEELGVSEASVQYECDLAKLIEQALLAERRLAMEEAAKIADTVEINYSGKGHITLPASTVRSNIAAKLRAAAEKEVGTKC
jgi:hypothetical protein